MGLTLPDNSLPGNPTRYVIRAFNSDGTGPVDLFTDDPIPFFNGFGYWV
jgi:hypothetical protein